jgi:hypothetical protein
MARSADPRHPLVCSMRRPAAPPAQLPCCCSHLHAPQSPLAPDASTQLPNADIYGGAAAAGVRGSHGQFKLHKPDASTGGFPSALVAAEPRRRHPAAARGSPLLRDASLYMPTPDEPLARAVWMCRATPTSLQTNQARAWRRHRHWRHSAALASIASPANNPDAQIRSVT